MPLKNCQAFQDVRLFKIASQLKWAYRGPMNFNQSKSDWVARLHDIYEDGIERVQRTTEEFESRMRDEIDDLSKRARDTALRGRDRTIQIGGDLAGRARENPGITALAIVGLALAVGSIWLASSRIRRH